MITNHDVQHIIKHRDELEETVEKLRDVNQGSGYTKIHHYAFKLIVTELLFYKKERDRLEEVLNRLGYEA